MLIEQAGLWADRLSINLELPTAASLKRLAPEKSGTTIAAAMGHMSDRITEAKEERRKFSPAGQSTQMIIGADATTDRDLLGTSAGLYGKYKLKRVYYSAFSPIPDGSQILPPKAPPLEREHRLYQADWLMRFYGFSVEEIASGGDDDMLDLAIDPKFAWALKNRGVFPVDVNTGPREMLLRVPGLGKRAVDRIISSRRHTTLRTADVKRLTVAFKRAAPFLITADHRPGSLTDRADLRARLVPPKQLSLL